MKRDAESVQPPDPALDEVATFLASLDPNGRRFGRVFRETFDQLYDGQRTGRYRVEDLFKTEKTHFGTLIEINLQREFGFEDGGPMDFRIAGHEVDCKFSLTSNWMLPPECFGQLLMLTEASDVTSCWGIGLIRADHANLRPGRNRDGKTGLNDVGRGRVHWLFKDAAMPPNALLQLPAQDVTRIMGLSSGQARVNELLRTAVGRRLTRNVIATVARQQDYMKRIRENGGARTALRSEGILVLSGDYTQQASLAEQLGTQVPGPGEVVSVRVVPTEAGAGVRIGNGNWRLAGPGETSVTDAPVA